MNPILDDLNRKYVSRTPHMSDIGARITAVQQAFKDLLGLPADFAVDGRQFDRLLQDGETLAAGSLRVQVLATPGHTPACVSYLIAGAAAAPRLSIAGAAAAPRLSIARLSAVDSRRASEQASSLRF